MNVDAKDSPDAICIQTITNHVWIAGRHYMTTWKPGYAVSWCNIKGEEKFYGFWKFKNSNIVTPKQ